MLVIRTFDTTMHYKTKFPRTDAVYANVTTLVITTIRYKDQSLDDRGSRYHEHSLYGVEKIDQATRQQLADTWAKAHMYQNCIGSI